MIKNILFGFVLLTTSNLLAANSQENSNDKVVMIWDVSVTRIYDQLTNTWTYVDDVFTTVTSEFPVNDLNGVQVSDHIYDVEVASTSNTLVSEIKEADYYLLESGPANETYRIRDTHQGAELNFSWSTNASGTGFRYISKLFILGSFRNDNFSHLDDFSAVLYLNQLIGQRFSYVESGVFNVAYGPRGGKEYRGNAVLRSFDIVPSLE